MTAPAARAVALHATSEGEGPPLLVLHGFTGSGESMQGVAAGLRDAYRVVRLDLVGHGASPAPRNRDAYTLGRCVAQVLAALDGLAIRSTHVLGYSMGGRLALALAVFAPERVRSALAVGASAGIPDAHARALRVAADEELAERIERDGLAPFVDAWMALPLFASQRRLGARALAEARAQRLRNRPHGLANSLRGMGSGAQPPLHEHLPAIGVPVGLVHGAEDAKFAAIAQDLARKLPRGETFAVPAAGHAAHLEQPQAFLRIARRFLAAADAQAPRAGPFHEPHAGAPS